MKKCENCGKEAEHIWGKYAYCNSPECIAKVRPLAEEAARISKIAYDKWVMAAKEEMEKAGLSFGDIVQRQAISIFMGLGPIVKGKLINRAGIPTIRFPSPELCQGGRYRKTIPWTPAWKKAI